MLPTYDIDSLDNRDEALIARLHALLYHPMKRYFRAQVRGVERIPTGAGLYVGNHSGGLMTPDSFVFGGAVYRQRGLDDVPYGLGHEWAICLPVIHQIIVPLGAVRASHENALRLFERGRKVLVYPGGDVDAMRPFSKRNQIIFDGRTGYIRLALRAGVPIIPVVCAGGHATLFILSDMRWLARALRMDRLPIRTHAWPLTFSLPWGLTPFPPPVYLALPSRIWIEVLDPIAFERTGEAAASDEAYVRACGEQVHGTMQAALTRLAEERARAR